MPQPKSKGGYRLGIVNPLTLVGNEVKTLLRERNFPFARVALLDSTGKVAGALTEVGDEPAVVAAASDDELEDLDLVFFCGPPAGNREWIDRYREDRFIVIDVSQPSTIREGALAVAGINLDSISSANGLIISPHPVAIPIGLILNQIGMLSAIELCAATVVQPASEFEQTGVEELARQAISVLNVQGVERDLRPPAGLQPLSGARAQRRIHRRSGAETSRQQGAARASHHAGDDLSQPHFFALRQNARRSLRRPDRVAPPRKLGHRAAGTG